MKTLIFDLDGTLIDSTPGIEAALAKGFEAAGRKMPGCDLSRVIGPPIAMIARAIEPSLTEAELVQIEKTYRFSYDTLCWRHTVAYPAVSDTLGLLRESGCQLFIVTNKPLLPTSNIVAHLGWHCLFVEVVTRDTRTPAYTTKAEMVSSVLSRNRLDPLTTMLIGDTCEDQSAAQANGLGFIHVAYGYGLLTSPALHSVNHFSEIVMLLETMHKQQSPGPNEV